MGLTPFSFSISRERSSSKFNLRATTARRTPSFASTVAMARPMPMLAPVTSAVFPERSRSMSVRLHVRVLHQARPEFGIFGEESGVVLGGFRPRGLGALAREVAHH